MSIRCDIYIKMEHQPYKGNSAKCYNIHDPLRYQAKGNKPVIKKTNSVCFHLYEISNIVKQQKGTKQNDGVQGLGKQGRKEELLFNGTGDGYRVSILQDEKVQRSVSQQCDKEFHGSSEVRSPEFPIRGLGMILNQETIIQAAQHS